MKIIIFILSILLLTFFGCGDDDKKDPSSNGSELSFSLAQESMKAIPVTTSSSKSNYVEFSGEKNLDSYINNFFKFECYMPGADNYCPEGVTPVFETHKFTSTTMIGLLYHIEMYLKNIYNTSNAHQSCSAFNGSATSSPTVNGITTNALNDSATLATYDCIGQDTFNGETNYGLYAKATDDIFSFLMSKRGTITGDYGLSDSIMQGYVRLASTSDSTITLGEPEMVAFNIVGHDDKNSDGSWDSSSDYTGRSVGIFNPTTHKFIVKHRSASTYVVAMGKGGYDDNGNLVSGYFMATSSSATTPICYLNAETPVQSNGSCDLAVSNFFAGPVAWSTIENYLDMSATDQTDLAGYETLVGSSNGTAFTSPTATEDFPSSLQ